MPEVGVRELKVRASEIVRDVHNRRTRYTITYRGRPVGALVPLEETRSATLPQSEQSSATAWEDLVRLGKKIGQKWPARTPSAKLLSAMRR